MTTVIAQSTETLSELYEKDETAWLEAMAELATHGRVESLDLVNLAEFLESMSRRDRNKVFSRFVQLMMHLLKWQYQPEMRSGSWSSSIEFQRMELQLECAAMTLRNHAGDTLNAAYEKAKKLAAKETGLEQSVFPTRCPFTLDELLADTELLA